MELYISVCQLTLSKLHLSFFLYDLFLLKLGLHFANDFFNPLFYQFETWFVKKIKCVIHMSNCYMHCYTQKISNGSHNKYSFSHITHILSLSDTICAYLRYQCYAVARAARWKFLRYVDVLYPFLYITKHSTVLSRTF